MSHISAGYFLVSCTGCVYSCCATSHRRACFSWDPEILGLQFETALPSSICPPHVQSLPSNPKLVFGHCWVQYDNPFVDLNYCGSFMYNLYREVTCVNTPNMSVKIIQIVIKRVNTLQHRLPKHLLQYSNGKLQ